jgi:hypothetical protein
MKKGCFGLYTVYDRVAEEAGPVFQARTKGVAIRYFQKLIADNSEVNAVDYWLYYLGSYDPVDLLLYGKDKAERVMISELEGVEASE